MTPARPGSSLCASARGRPGPIPARPSAPIGPDPGQRNSLPGDAEARTGPRDRAEVVEGRFRSTRPARRPFRGRVVEKSKTWGQQRRAGNHCLTRPPVEAPPTLRGSPGSGARQGVSADPGYAPGGAASLARAALVLPWWRCRAPMPWSLGRARTSGGDVAPMLASDGRCLSVPGGVMGARVQRRVGGRTIAPAGARPVAGRVACRWRQWGSCPSLPRSLPTGRRCPGSERGGGRRSACCG